MSLRPNSGILADFIQTRPFGKAPDEQAPPPRAYADLLRAMQVISTRPPLASLSD